MGLECMSNLLVVQYRKPVIIRPSVEDAVFVFILSGFSGMFCWYLVNGS